MAQVNAFQPPLLLRNPHLQSVLGSLTLRQHRITGAAAAMLAASRSEVIDCGAGVRLLAEHTPPPGHDTDRLALLIHGWEGSAHSGYVVSAALQLATAGFRVIRLNLRDHGGSHHLNPELFHSCRLQEVLDAAVAVQSRFPDEQLFLGGFSLGGNFALRVAAEAPGAGLRLAKVVAVCPVLDPRRTLSALDGGLPWYRTYFLRKWSASLERKRASFPHLYEFGELSRFRTLREMTDYFVRHYTGYADLDTYLRGYAVTGPRLAGLAVPGQILLAEDDPVIPADDADRLARPPTLTVHRSRHGGHCGFLYDYRLRSWIDDYLLQAFGGSRGGRP